MSVAEKVRQSLAVKGKMNLDAIWVRIQAGEATKDELDWFKRLCEEHKAEQMAVQGPRKPR